MKHHIIVKWNNKIENKSEIIVGIQELFYQSINIEGIDNVHVFQSVIDLSNRFDLMIVLEMEKEALRLFDESLIHQKWKENYSQYIEQKVIFDCD